MNKTKRKKTKFLKLLYQLQNYWKLGWLDNKARYAKTYLGEVWIALSVILLSSMLANTSGLPRSSKLAIAEKVVPRSIPITFDILFDMIS